MKKSNIAVFSRNIRRKKLQLTAPAPPIPVIDEELSIPIVEDPLIVSVESAIVHVDEGTETPTATKWYKN